MRAFLAFLAILGSLVPARAAAPLSLHPENPHYFLFRNQPTIIITSGEHYGAVLNLDFDYVAYLNELQARNLNCTRTFTGVYFEPQGAFNIADNSMAPANGRYIGPWPRTGVPGATHGGNKFDLNRWNEAYFARLRDFVRQAGLRGVIVELNLFCPFYDEAQWKLSPMNTINNINKVGDIVKTNVYTLDQNGPLLAIQENLVRRIVLDLNQFDNLYYEICNEPYFGGVTLAWQNRISQVITEAERTLPNKHLISQNIANGAVQITQPNPLVSIFNFHYATPPNAVALNYGLNKVIGDNETGFRGTNNLPYRREAWEFILAGGGLFNNLDYSFTARAPAGTFVNYPATQPGGGNPVYREQLRTLRNFINKFDFLRLQPTTSFIVGGVPPGGTVQALSDTNNAWAVYLGPPPPPPGADSFSVRWSGKFRAPRTGDYTFYTMSNDGVRLSIDNRLIIDNWSPHSEKEDSATINLEGGKVHAIRVEYFQSGGNAVMRLAWKPPGGARTMIPGLLTARNAWGLDAEYYKGQNFETLAFRRVDPNINFDWSGKSPFEAGPTSPTPHAAELELALPRGRYVATWVSPRTGRIEKTQRFDHRSGTRKITSPAYDEDMALDLRRVSERTGKRILDILR